MARFVLRPFLVVLAITAAAPARAVNFTFSTGMIPGMTRVVTPYSRRSPRNSNHTLASKKNCEIPKSAWARLAAWRWRSPE